MTAISFYGVSEVARSIEDPYSWDKPCHDLTGSGWRVYCEALQLHEASVADEVVTPAAQVLGPGPAGPGAGAPRAAAAGPCSVAHGPVDTLILSDTTPVEELTAAVAERDAARAAAAAAAAAKQVDGGAVSRSASSHGGMDSHAETIMRAELLRNRPPELSEEWYGFFTDVFRLKGTIHPEIIPQAGADTRPR